MRSTCMGFDYASGVLKLGCLRLYVVSAVQKYRLLPELLLLLLFQYS